MGEPGDCVKSVGVGETGGDKVAVLRLSTLVDNHRGAEWVSRGARDLCEGKALKEESQERLRHETRPRNSDLLGSRCEVERTWERNRGGEWTTRLLWG